MTPQVVFNRIFENSLALLDGDRILGVEASLNHLLHNKEAMQLAERASAVTPEANFWPASDSWEARFRPYNVEDGILRIPVQGVLLDKFPLVVGDYATGYQYIQQALLRGRDDENVKGIVYVSNSPGGTVLECFETALLSAEVGKIKPIMTHAQNCCSAAYAICCTSQKIFVHRLGNVGSIGVITHHISLEENLKKVGIEITPVFVGERKNDGSPYEALKPAAKERMLKRLNLTMDLFVETVAAGRQGKLTPQQIRDMEAMTYLPQDAIDIGLADAIGDLDSALEDIILTCDGTSENEENQPSSDPDNDGSPDDPEDEAKVQTMAMTPEERAALLAEDRKRMRDITGCEAAQKRPKLAQHLALSGMSLEDATATLNAAAEEPASAQTATVPANTTQATTTTVPATPAANPAGTTQPAATEQQTQQTATTGGQAIPTVAPGGVPAGTTNGAGNAAPGTTERAEQFAAFNQHGGTAGAKPDGAGGGTTEVKTAAAGRPFAALLARNGHTMRAKPDTVKA